MERELVNSHLFECLGVDDEGNDVFIDDDDNPQKVIASVFRDGLMRPACSMFNDGYCSAMEEPDERGKCPYSQPPRN